MLNIIKGLTILCFVIQYIYWYVSAWKTEQSKPKSKAKISLSSIMRSLILPLLQVCISIQMVKQPILYFPYAPVFLPFVGLLLTVTGLYICIIARKTLGDNWTNAYEYQVKPRHELITSGIYSVIRHPIYLGLTLMLIGGEMVAGSLLFISFFAFFLVFYVQGKREEKLFLSHFGKRYAEYMNRTKMLIPQVL